MDGNKNRVIRAILILLLGSPPLLYDVYEGVATADVSDADVQHEVNSSVLAADEKHSESDIADYFEKTKNEILQGRKFSDQSTPANTLLTLISAYHHQDQKTLEQIFPIVKMKQFERLSSPEVRSQMLGVARNSIFCRIEIEDKAPEESDLCAIYTRESPEKPIDQIWSFAYVEGAWRFVGSTISRDDWKTQAKQAEAMSRNILQSEAEKTEAAATNTPQQKANKIEGKWQATLTEFNQMYVMRFWRKADGTLAGAATRNSPHDRPFDTVAFENGKLRLEEKTNQAVFEGMMKEDGLTIEGKLQKPDLTTPCVLERIEDVEIEDKDQGINKQVRGAPKPDESTVSQVLSLDGKTGCMRIVDSQSLHSFSDAITIEVWLKASSFCIESGDINSIIRKNVVPGAENFLLRFLNINGSLMLDMCLGSEVGSLKVSHEFTVGTWYHLVGIYDGSSITIYINGLAIDSKSVSGRLHIDQSDLYVGRGDPTFSAGEYFHGMLDEIRIWNVARSQEQIQATINSQLSGMEEGLVGYWNFEDGTAKDMSGHGNDGILDGDARIVESSRPASVTVQKESSNMLLAWWKLDEADSNVVADSSGNACGGKLVGNPQWRPAGGKVGGALEFDGDGDYVHIDNESAFDITGPITIAAWFKVNTFDKRWQSLITKGDTSWRLQRYAEEDTLAFHCTGITSVTGQRPEGIEGKKNVNDGQWHHVVGVYDGSEILLYIDGVLDNSSKASGEISMNDWAVIIGGNSERSGRTWNGLIDEVDIICGAIDANAVQALYTGADPGIIAQKANPQLQSSDKLIACWKFEDNVNDSASDNRGIIHGNPTYVDGKFGRAISLDGDDYVDFGNPDSLNFGTGDWTLSAWIKTTQSGVEDTSKGTVFANGADGGGGVRYTLAVNEGQNGSITLTADDDKYKVQAVSNAVVNDGAWHHVVGTRNAGQLHLYVDGVLDRGDYLPEEFDLSGASGQNAYIGTITSNDDNSLYKYYVGSIDEVCIFAGAINAKGILALYSGKNPVTVAKMILIKPEAQPKPTRRSTARAVGDIEGDWQLSTNPAIIQIRRKSDGSLEATAVAESPGTASPPIPLDDVTFENGMLRFKATPQQAVFEGKMNENGMTIEGQIQQQEQVTPAVLKRVVPTSSKAVPVEQEQLQESTSDKSNIVVALVLVLVLAGVVAGVVYFLVKSSVR